MATSLEANANVFQVKEPFDQFIQGVSLAFILWMWLNYS